ncbi:M23 family metallopeptidase [Kitasatospora sp. NPDC049285]|uniref:M23 family metallopeptidase n=1 Tax=Kitasatospora sp. NPDC049285 TaxID=3157096 RepID=UPI003432D32C
MRSLPATGRRLLQAISARHVRDLLSTDLLTAERVDSVRSAGAARLAAARKAPGKALAGGAAVVAVGALLIPGGHAAAQTVHPTTPGASAFTVQGVQLQPGEVQLSSPVAYQVKGAHPHAEVAVAANLDRTAPAAEQPAAQPQDDRAARDSARTELPAAEQPAAPQPAAEQPAAAAPVAAQPAPEPAKPSWSSPAPGASISNPYHKTNAEYAAGYHTGTDFAVSVGTPLVAVGDATVVSSGWAGAYGNQIVLKLSDGRFAQYAHLSQLGVKAGQHVGAGDQIGKSGTTGNSTGPHLHFEIRTANKYAAVIDPIAYLKQHGATNF